MKSFISSHPEGVIVLGIEDLDQEAALSVIENRALFGVGEVIPGHQARGARLPLGNGLVHFLCGEVIHHTLIISNPVYPVTVLEHRVGLLSSC